MLTVLRYSVDYDVWSRKRSWPTGIALSTLPTIRPETLQGTGLDSEKVRECRLTVSSLRRNGH